MRNLSLRDRNPGELRDTANGGGIDGHYIGPLRQYFSPPYSRGGFCAATPSRRPPAASFLIRATASPPLPRGNSPAGASRPSPTPRPAPKLVESTLPSYSPP